MIGVFGGTFDPVHNGHLLTVEAVAKAMSLERVLFVPNRQPPHRARPWLDTPVRVQLLQLALQPFPLFELECCELDRSGPSYMVDTLAELQTRYAGQTLCLILGMDALLGFNRWHCWPQILQRCHLLVTQRPGFVLQAAQLDEQLRKHLCQEKSELAMQPGGKILLQSVPQLAISSTQIRQRLQTGQDASEWLPENVYKHLLRLLEDE